MCKITRVGLDRKSGLKWNGTSAVCCITPSSNKLTLNSFGLARITPLISILLFGKNPLPNASCARLIVAVGLDRKSGLKWNGTSAVCCITPSSNKLTLNSFGLARITPLISILLFGKNPLPNASCARLIVAGSLKN
uniref:Candidate secreted effector n=1 Tax=Meloidogyne incognita TaxID=6306 RepID=A0A914LYZ8_MELIC